MKYLNSRTPVSSYDLTKVRYDQLGHQICNTCRGRCPWISKSGRDPLILAFVLLFLTYFLSHILNSAHTECWSNIFHLMHSNIQCTSWSDIFETPPKMPWCALLSWSLTTRKSTKTNKITDGIILSVIFTDEYNSISNFVGLYRQTFAVGNNYQWHRFRRQFDRSIPTEYFRRYISTEWPTEYIEFWNKEIVWWRGIFSDDFIDGVTEGFKPGSPYSDMAHSPSDLPTDIPTGRVRQWFHR